MTRQPCVVRRAVFAVGTMSQIDSEAAIYHKTHLPMACCN